MPVLVVHPWELTGRPTPGELGGIAGFVHETGRMGFMPRFQEILATLPWTSIRAAAGLPVLAARSYPAALPLRAARSRLAT